MKLYPQPTLYRSMLAEACYELSLYKSLIDRPGNSIQIKFVSIEKILYVSYSTIDEALILAARGVLYKSESYIQHMHLSSSL